MENLKYSGAALRTWKVAFSPLRFWCVCFWKPCLLVLFVKHTHTCFSGEQQTSGNVHEGILIDPDNKRSNFWQLAMSSLSRIRPTGHGAFYIVFIGILGFVIAIETFVNELSFYNWRNDLGKPAKLFCLHFTRENFISFGNTRIFFPQTTCQMSLPQIEVVDFSKSLRLKSV